MLKYFIIVITTFCNATLLLQEMQVVRNALQTTNRSKPCLFDISIR